MSLFHTYCLAVTTFVLLARLPLHSQTPPETTIFSTAAEEAYSNVQIAGGNGGLTENSRGCIRISRKDRAREGAPPSIDFPDMKSRSEEELFA